MDHRETYTVLRELDYELLCGTDTLPHPRGRGCLTRQAVDENASLSSNIEASEPMTYIYFHGVGALIINARGDWPMELTGLRAHLHD